MSYDLFWSKHIAQISSKAYRILSLPGGTFWATNNITTKKSLYISLVRSQLLYGSQILRPVLTLCTQKLFTRHRLLTQK